VEDNRNSSNVKVCLYFFLLFFGCIFQGPATKTAWAVICGGLAGRQAFLPGLRWPGGDNRAGKEPGRPSTKTCHERSIWKLETNHPRRPRSDGPLFNCALPVATSAKNERMQICFSAPGLNADRPKDVGEYGAPFSLRSRRVPMDHTAAFLLPFPEARIA
jgi:hypothetical protein